MTDKELKRLSRADLMQMILDLTLQNRTLREKLENAEKALAARELNIQASGTLAEAALRLNGIFEAADKACQQYTENMKRLYGETPCDADAPIDESIRKADEANE